MRQFCSKKDNVSQIQVLEVFLTNLVHLFVKELDEFNFQLKQKGKKFPEMKLKLKNIDIWIIKFRYLTIGKIQENKGKEKEYHLKLKVFPMSRW